MGIILNSVSAMVQVTKAFDRQGGDANASFGAKIASINSQTGESNMFTDAILRFYDPQGKLQVAEGDVLSVKGEFAINKHETKGYTLTISVQSFRKEVSMGTQYPDVFFAHNDAMTGGYVKDMKQTQTQNGNMVTSFFVVAPSHFVKNGVSEQQMFFKVEHWGALPFALADGQYVTVGGALQGQYDKDSGKTYYKIASNRIMPVAAFNRHVPRNGGGAPAPGFGNAPTPAASAPSFGGGSAPQTPNFAQTESPFGAMGPLDISDDDLPF